jgi:hypothetical protein
LLVVARPRRIPAVFSCRGSKNDTHRSDIGLIDAGMHLAFDSPCKQSRQGHRSLLVIGMHPNGTHDMKLSIAAAIVLASSTLISATLTGAMLSVPAVAGSDQGLPCIARVIHSEELPFAPINTWLVKVTLEITPPNGGAFVTTLQDSIPWQVAPPRRGQTFRLRCDPANPGNLHLMSQAAAQTAF